MPIEISRRAAVFRLSAAFLLAAAVAAILLLFPPEHYAFYPRCPVYTWLHLRCPGCGATRALAALLRGRWSEAVRWNALVVLGALPAFAAYAALCAFRLLRRGNGPHAVRFQWPVIPTSLSYMAIALALGFGILRNV